jgi:NAD(P)-dependent dehydrogenase (short-subunit alcohol dehydrogenase family)
MSTATAAPPVTRKPELDGQTVVLFGGSAGIGLETARRARGEGADVILVGRDTDKLQWAATEVRARSTAKFDATDPEAIDAFFAGLADPIDHVLVTAGRAPYYGPLAELDFEEVSHGFNNHQVQMLAVARYGAPKVRPGGSLLFMGGTGGRATARGLALTAAGTAALPPLTANLALEVAPVRVNLIAAGFVDTPLSADLLGDQLDARRKQLRERLPIRRVVEAADVAALAVHLMSNTALTGATYDIDGGQQLVNWA